MFVMWNSEEQKAVGSRQKAENLSAFVGTARYQKVFFCLLLSAFCLLAASCRRDMQDQPKAKAYRENSFFRDGLASRPLVPGTVPRGYLRADREFYFGKKSNPATTAASQQVAPGSAGTAVPTTGAPTNRAALYPDDVDTFPFPITKEVLDRGQQRYDIFCSVCHGATGNGDGMIARRGFNKPSPASYHQDRLRQAPVGHFFDVMTNGWGAMPSYATQIPVEDRWKIIAYIRALQLSQMPPAQAVQAPSTKPGGQDVRAPEGKK
jgi:mono/diheme cytochrome c family protein